MSHKSSTVDALQGRCVWGLLELINLHMRQEKIQVILAAAGSTHFNLYSLLVPAAGPAVNLSKEGLFRTPVVLVVESSLCIMACPWSACD